VLLPLWMAGIAVGLCRARVPPLVAALLALLPLLLVDTAQLERPLDRYARPHMIAALQAVRARVRSETLFVPASSVHVLAHYASPELVLPAGKMPATPVDLGGVRVFCDWKGGIWAYRNALQAELSRLAARAGVVPGERAWAFAIDETFPDDAPAVAELHRFGALVLVSVRMPAR
jgi:hypothetical protein